MTYFHLNHLGSLLRLASCSALCASARARQPCAARQPCPLRPCAAVLARRARQAAEVWPLRVLEPRARRGLRAGAQATSAERPGAGRWQLGAQGDGRWGRRARRSGAGRPPPLGLPLGLGFGTWETDGREARWLAKETREQPSGLGLSRMR